MIGRSLHGVDQLRAYCPLQCGCDVVNRSLVIRSVLCHCSSLSVSFSPLSVDMALPPLTLMRRRELALPILMTGECTTGKTFSQIRRCFDE